MAMRAVGVRVLVALLLGACLLGAAVLFWRSSYHDGSYRGATAPVGLSHR
jgi:hypothetical protein